MKVIKAMLYLCITGTLFAMSAVQSNGKLLIVIFFLSVAGTFFAAALEYEKKLITLNNDLYEHMY